MNKKIFIALLLCAVSMCTWAASFGNHGSTWTVGYSEDIDLYIEVKHKSDWSKLNLGWSGDIQVNHGNQKKVVIVGPITQDVIQKFISVDEYKQCFATAFSLDMSGATFEGGSDSQWESLKSQLNTLWNGLAWAHSENNIVVGKIYYPGDAVVHVDKNHMTLSSSFAPNDVLEIHPCPGNCPHTLEWILNKAGITSENRFDLVKINLDNDQNEVTAGLSEINAFTLDLTGVDNLNDWDEIENEYVSNVIIRKTDDLEPLDKSVVKNFDKDKLYNVIVVEDCHCGPNESLEVHMDAYVNKPGFFATGLQYVSAFNPQFNKYEPQWYNKNIENHNGMGYKYDAQSLNMLRLSGYVFARDLKSTDYMNVDENGHLIPLTTLSFQDVGQFKPGACNSDLAPSKKDPYRNGVHVNYCSGTGYSDMTFTTENKEAGQITNLDLREAQFGYVDKSGMFQYYPADMTLSELQYFDNWRSIAHLYLPTSRTQYIIPEAFLWNSQYVREVCIPYNYKEIHRYAFSGLGIDTLRNSNGEIYGYKGGINHFTTTAADDDEIKCLRRGDLIDYGEKTLALPSTTEFVGRGAFAGYDGAALLEDVYVLAPKAPICESFAFDQKTYLGNSYHHKGHLIKKGNYVDANMAMLHFPNTTDRIEMLNYSDMTRKYRLYDETGHYDNLGNILVWPTQQQYNRSFNQALAGVTWWAWNENIDGTDNPEFAFSAGQVAGGGYHNANFEYMFPHAASYENGFSDDFAVAYGKRPQNTFDGSESKGSTYNNSLISEWKKELLDNSIPQDQNDRPLSYNFELYGGWHQFVIAELYDFLLDDPGPDKPKDFYNFEKYNKNIWYTICFDFNLTKAQLRKAFGDPEHGKDPFLSTLAGVTRDANKLGITIHMSKDLLHNKLVYEEDYPNTVKCDLAHGNYATYEEVEYGDDDIVVEANKPYFILPCLPEKELIQAATGYRRCEYTPVKEEKAMFPVPTHVHAVNANSTKYMNGQDEAVNDTAYAFNYYFVGNYLPDQPMPVNSYYLGLTKKSNGDWWSSFFRMTPDKEKTWGVKSAIVMAMVEDNTSNNHAGSKGHLEVKEKQYTYNYYWNAEPYDDFVFFAGKSNQTHAKTAFGINVEDNYTTSIELPIDYLEDEATKVYNLNGQFVGIDADKMSKGVYIVGGKKVVVK